MSVTMVGGMRRCSMPGLAASILVMSALAGMLPAQGQSASQGLSDDSVKVILKYAWQQTPPRFTKPDNTVVEIDIKKPEAVVVPVEVAREIIIAARRSALAQICKLEEHQVANYRSLMVREVQKKKWSEQQMVFINMIHLTTVQIFSGDVTINNKDDAGNVVSKTPLENKRAQSCTDAEAAKLKEQIEAYVAQGPVFDLPGAAPATPAAAAGSPPAEVKPAATAPKAEKK
jgi:hypothetical protein